MIVPEYLQSRQYTCQACSAQQPVDWFQKQFFPKDSVASTAEVEGFWVPISFTNNCRLCGVPNFIVAEDAPVTGRLTICGDEAAREIDDLYFFLIAGCGISPDIRDRTEREIADIEGELRTRSKGRHQSFHATDLMNARLWPEVTFERRLSFLKRMCRLARSVKVTKFITAGAVRVNGQSASKAQRFVRDQVFSAYTMRVLQTVREAGFVPLFQFDQVQAGKVSGWANECMAGLRRYPLFVWFSRRAHIPGLEYIAPGSTAESKIADCLAFVTAREFLHNLNGARAYVPTSEYGRSFFSGFDGAGNLLFSDGTGYPWQRIFGIGGGR